MSTYFANVVNSVRQAHIVGILIPFSLRVCLIPQEATLLSGLVGGTALSLRIGGDGVVAGEPVWWLEPGSWTNFCGHVCRVWKKGEASSKICSKDVDII